MLVSHTSVLVGSLRSTRFGWELQPGNPSMCYSFRAFLRGPECAHRDTDSEVAEDLLFSARHVKLKKENIGPSER